MNADPCPQKKPALSLALSARAAMMRVVLFSDQDCLVDLSAPQPFGQTKGLVDLIAQAFQQSNLPDSGLQDIQRLFIDQGPGSFAGLRTALAWAIGFCLPLDERAPALHVYTGYQALLKEYQDQRLRGLWTEKVRLLLALDSRRDAVFYARYTGYDCVETGQRNAEDLIESTGANELCWCDPSLDLPAPFMAQQASAAAIYAAAMAQPACQDFSNLAFYGRQADVDQKARQV